MGLYSEVINTFPHAGDTFIGVLQTKNLDCALEQYYVTKDGKLYKIDYGRYGKNGRVIPWRLTCCINLVNSRLDRVVFCFKDGMLFHWRYLLTPGA